VVPIPQRQSSDDLEPGFEFSSSPEVEGCGSHEVAFSRVERGERVIEVRCFRDAQGREFFDADGFCRSEHIGLERCGRQQGQVVVRHRFHLACAAFGRSHPLI